MGLWRLDGVGAGPQEKALGRGWGARGRSVLMGTWYQWINCPGHVLRSTGPQSPSGLKPCASLSWEGPELPPRVESDWQGSLSS